jgi:hypothetical protein
LALDEDPPGAVHHDPEGLSAFECAGAVAPMQGSSRGIRSSNNPRQYIVERRWKNLKKFLAGV